MKDVTSSIPTKILGAVCTVIAGQSPKATFYNASGDGLPFYQGKKEFTERYIGSPTTWTTNVTKRAEPGDILMSVRAPVGPINEATQEICIGRGLAAIRPRDGLDRNYLWYALLWLQPEIKGNAGAVFESINKAGIEKLEIPLPPLEEQRRIVAVLDEAFEGLARARANAEANLQNARELFASSLADVVRPERKDWKEIAVADSVQKTRIPAKVKKKDYKDAGLFPIVSQEADLISGFWDNPADVVKLHRPLVIFGDHTRVLKYVDFDFVVGADGTQLMAPIPALDPEFYYYALRTIDLQGKGYARHYSHLKKESLWFPSDLGEQRQIAAGLRKLESATRQVGLEYEHRVLDLDDLRQSLLQQAFAGALT